MVIMGRKNIKVKKKRGKINNDSFYHLMKDRKRDRKNQFILFSDKTLEFIIHNWFHSLVKVSIFMD